MDARRLLDELHGRLERILTGPDVFGDAVKVIADTMAVASAAPHLDAKSLDLARRVAGASSGSQPLLGTGLKAGMLEALAVNAYFSHALELDDWLPLGYVHAGAVVVPAALAAAIDAGSSLESMARAVAAGYEVAGFFGAVLGRRHYSTWHTTATAGAAGAAAAFALSRGLDEQASLGAAVVALNYMGGLWAAASGGRIKPFSTMHAATLGAEAALLVESGGQVEPARVVEAICETYGCDEPSLPREPLLRFSRLKFYSACYHSHSAIAAAERVAAEIRGATPGRVVVRTYSEAVRVAGLRSPGSVEEARFSIPFLVALALLGRRPMPGSLGKALGDPAVLELASRVVLEVDGEHDRLYPNLMPATLEVAVEGKVYRARVEAPPKTLVQEVGFEEVARKAEDLARDAGSRYPGRVARALLEAGPGERVAEVISRLL